MGAVAGLAHERCDGSGYPRGLSRSALPPAARILSVACAYRAMNEPRPHRPAMSPKEAAVALHADVRAGRLAAEDVDAVLAADGARRPRRRSGPAGLTPRELEVLTLIARGATTRSTATLFAVHHDLLDGEGPIVS